jgi:hypothetical protein
MGQYILQPFNRRGRELRLAARPLLVLTRIGCSGNQINKNQTKKPFTQKSLQNRVRTRIPAYPGAQKV